MAKEWTEPEVRQLLDSLKPKEQRYVEILAWEHYWLHQDWLYRDPAPAPRSLAPCSEIARKLGAAADSARYIQNCLIKKGIIKVASRGRVTFTSSLFEYEIRKRLIEAQYPREKYPEMYEIPKQEPPDLW
jgi:hypothetical protein